MIKNKIFVFLIAMVMLLTPVFAINSFDTIRLNADTYNYSPTPVVSGEDFEMWIQLTNKSNIVAKNIDYYIETSYPFVVISEKEGRIESLAPYQSKIIKYKIRTDSKAITGTYDIDFKYSREGLFAYNVKKYIIDVKGQSAIVDIISSDIKEVNIGVDTEITLNLRNLGRKDAKDIFVTLDDSQDNIINVLGLKTVYIEKINIGSEAFANFKVSVSKDAVNKTYTLPITINYSDDDREHEVLRNIGLKTIDDPKILLHVNNVGNDFKIRPNTEERISLEIYNVGNVDTEMVYVIIKTPAANNIQEFIGSIEKDNYDSIDLRFNTGSLKEKNYPMTIELYYKDSFLKEQKITKEITLDTDFSGDVNRTNKIIMSIIGIIGFVIGLAIVILLLRWLFKILIKPAYKIVANIFKRK